MFDVLIDLFYRFGLRNKMREMVIISFRPCHTPGGILEAAYEIRATEVGPSYW